MKRLLVAFTFLLTAALIAAGVVYSWGKSEFEAAGPLSERLVLQIPRGADLESITEKLHVAGVIRQPLVFRVGARLTGEAKRMKAGEFAFPAGVSPQGALNIIVSGRTVVHRLTVPEGLRSAEVVAAIEGTEALSGGIETVPPEGTLLPETYHYHRGDSRSALLGRMREAMASLKAEIWPGRAENLPFDTWREAVTLASIVEMETAVAEERALVAGVFVNRLRRGMRLQSDPTVRYAVTDGDGGMERALTRADLRIEHPYNTYHRGGLPPGPIANPGRAAIEAVLNPADTDYLYFVADGTGGHAFAKTLREHNRNAAEWRRIRDGKD